ncbi:alpha/beta-hydrolase [Neurospora crassa]|uniref:Mitochondrial hydrolase n=1 Tax=Neurospora crassa (strain ATCC 24698 / 74-OR23-1A / CBS 708.71 / DSM 1257 / FGSC 987) TaxID=367110 RepID=A3RNH6_NEUCR|nr:mitochondrial hydrolase [Neurospora crassa OR74A]EAA26606.2 mitochondrial hydrolase [Neurospora crassa OR74A]KHE83678.1 alpha/beta-hydrolase [Neurospora crassa]|eukprot:XP_955842.2 mitochondrial hydrolase [Neurospora crassa OR74A]
MMKIAFARAAAQAGASAVRVGGGCCSTTIPTISAVAGASATLVARRLFSSASAATPSSTATNTVPPVVSTVPLVYDLHSPENPTVPNKETQPIIFIHGLFGSKKNNRSISKQLARDLGRHIFAIDLRNHGESPHDPRHDYTAMSEDVAAFIRSHGLKDSTLIGHSMGAKAAMTVALTHPDLVQNIISVDNAPVDARLQSSFARYIQGLKKIEEAGVSSLSAADKILEPYEKDLVVRQFLLGNLHRPRVDPGGKPSPTLQFRNPLGIIGKSLDHMGDFPFKDPHRVRFGKPALFVRGTKSHYVPDEVIPLIGQFFPLFELVDVEGGHWVISENPEAFRQAVLKFLEPKE